MIDRDDIRYRYQGTAAFLDERGRRLFAANEALAHGFGGVTAAAVATGLARSTINRGIRELRSGQNPIGNRVRRAGGGRKSAVTHQPGLPAALEGLIEDAIRGDPGSPLRWVSRSLRHLVKALSAKGFQASQRVVSNLLRDLKYSCQANQKTREATTRIATRSSRISTARSKPRSLLASRRFRSILRRRVCCRGTKGVHYELKSYRTAA